MNALLPVLVGKPGGRVSITQMSERLAFTKCVKNGTAYRGKVSIALVKSNKTRTKEEPKLNAATSARTHPYTLHGKVHTLTQNTERCL